VRMIDDEFCPFKGAVSDGEVDHRTETDAGDLALGAGFKEKLAGFEVAISDGDVEGGVRILILEVWVCIVL